MSIRNGRWRWRQNRERDPDDEEKVLTEERMPEEGGVTVPRPGRFPKEADPLDGDGSNPSCDSLMGLRSGMSCDPNEHARSRETLGDAEMAAQSAVAKRKEVEHGGGGQG